MPTIAIRGLHHDDCLAALNDTLRKAHDAWASGQGASADRAQGLDRSRVLVARGSGLVALVDGRVVGVVVLGRADRCSPVRWFREPTVGRIVQLVVDPRHQRTGVGQALIQAAEAWAVSREFRYLALATPMPARHLHTYCRRRGFVPADTVQMEGQSCHSVIWIRRLSPRPARLPWSGWPARHPAERTGPVREALAAPTAKSAASPRGL